LLRSAPILLETRIFLVSLFFYRAIVRDFPFYFLLDTHRVIIFRTLLFDEPRPSFFLEQTFLPLSRFRTRLRHPSSSASFFFCLLRTKCRQYSMTFFFFFSSMDKTSAPFFSAMSFTVSPRAERVNITKFTSGSFSSARIEMLAISCVSYLHTLGYFFSFLPGKCPRLYL